MPFEPLSTQSVPAKASKFEPLSPSYNYAPPASGDEEKIMFHGSDAEVKAPIGTGRMFSEIQNDDVFDPPPSSTLDETAATFEKQAAYIALVANAYGVVPDDGIADFVASRSKALANAQKNQPEYMKQFQSQLDSSKGFFETAGVFMSNPRAIGRTAVTQSPNSILPLMTTLAGAAAGAGAGTAIPGVGNVAGAVVGGVAGAVPGGALVEIGSTIDQLMIESGVDVTDANQVSAALQNDALMNDIKIKAEKKGITTASIDAMFQIFGGRFVKAMAGKGLAKKAAGFAADTAVQSVGEFTGEAAGQQVAFGKVDYKDAAMEAVSSIAQSAGQTAIGATIPGKKKVDAQLTPAEPMPAEASTTTAPVEASTAPPPPAVRAQAEAISSADTAVQDFGIDTSTVPVSQKEAVGRDILEIEQVAPAALEKIKARGVEDIKDLRIQLTEQRINDLERMSDKLKADIDRVDTEEEARPIRQQLDKVEKQIDRLVVDSEALITSQKVESASQTILRQKASNQKIAAAFKEGVFAAKKDVKSAQTAIIDLIESSGISAEDKAKFTRTVKNIQTEEQANKALPEIKERLSKYADSQTRSGLISSIKKTAKKAKTSNVIAADYAKAILDIVDDIDTTKRKPETLARLQKSLDYFNKNPDKKAPKILTQKLEILSKKPVADLTTDELNGLHNDIMQLISRGRLKKELKDRAAQRRQEKRLEALQGNIVPMVYSPLATASIGERISLMDEVKNKFLTGANKARSVSLALNPMDVVFDMIDNNADYKGPAHTIFKKAVDASFSRYLNLKEATTRDVKNLADKLDLDDKNFERIGVYAAAQQEGGIKKLEATGITKQEIDSIKLSDGEMQFYNLMRQKLDAMFPAINQVMVDVYNKNVDQVSDYFPFMTDFEAMDNSHIVDMLGNDAPSLVGATPEQALKSKKKNVERGFTKSRTGGAQVIRLDAMNVFLRHVDNAAYLVEMSRDLKELGELAQSKQFGDMAGDMSQQFVTDWIDLLARKGKAENRVSFLDALRVNVGAAVLGFKLSSILIQPTALADGAALIGGDYVARGVKQIATSSEWRSFLKDNLPEIRERVGDDPAYLDMGGKSKIAHVREAGFWALKNLDLLSASTVAAGAYMRSVEQRGGVVDLSNPDPVAIQEAQLYLRRTQSSSFAKDSPMVISAGKLTGNSSLDKLIFQFQSFMLNRWSIIKHDIAKVGIGRGKTAQAMNATAFLLLAMSMELGVRRLSKEMISALVGGDDLDPWEETVKAEAVKTAIGTVPIVSNIVGSMEYGSNPVPAVSLTNDIFKKLQYAQASKSEDKKTKHYSSAAILAVGAALGIPGTLQAEQLSRKLQTDEKKSKSGF